MSSHRRFSVEISEEEVSFFYQPPLFWKNIQTRQNSNNFGRKATNTKLRLLMHWTKHLANTFWTNTKKITRIAEAAAALKTRLLKILPSKLRFSDHPLRTFSRWCSFCVSRHFFSLHAWCWVLIAIYDFSLFLKL